MKGINLAIISMLLLRAKKVIKKTSEYWIPKEDLESIKTIAEKDGDKDVGPSPALILQVRKFIYNVL